MGVWNAKVGDGNDKADDGNGECPDEAAGFREYGVNIDLSSIRLVSGRDYA